MTDAIDLVHDIPVWLCAPDGPIVRETRDALDLIGDAGYHEARWVVLPVARLDGDFFRLRTGLAGEVLQKFAQYDMRLAVVGDITSYVEASTALRDLVRESNRGTQTWFLADLDALGARLAGTGDDRTEEPGDPRRAGVVGKG
ncbi:DUF4180 domain-containing protein [Streptomyces sp. SID3343]|uniref:DUF4180 domain-containing protein n=1 Tax=Streptomyces sp. SID3343 TaxID=2690260 RepID=UPI00136E7B1F|nr:DUF4180 domain-containing protein [Streptomyces sp. SID3343]